MRSQANAQPLRAHKKHAPLLVCKTSEMANVMHNSHAGRGVAQTGYPNGCWQPVKRCDVGATTLA